MTEQGVREASPPLKLTRRQWLAAAAALGGGALWASVSSVSASSARAAETRFPPLGDFEMVEGARIHVYDRGPRQAPALILIHGASGNIRDFGFGFSESLLDRYRVIALDRPGHGHSERGPGEAHRPDAQARLLRQAVAARGVERAIVLGHSFGCAVALAWALDAPESVVGVVDVAGAAMPWPGGVDFTYRLADAPLIGRIASHAVSALISDEYVEKQVAAIFAPQSPPEGYLKGVGAPLALRPEAFRHNGRDVKNLKDFLKIQSKSYPALRPPLEIVHGRADTIVPAWRHAEPLANLAPKARLTLLDGVGHMPHHAARKHVIDAIDRMSKG